MVICEFPCLGVNLFIHVPFLDVGVISRYRWGILVTSSFVVVVVVSVSDASVVVRCFHEAGGLFHVVSSADCSRMPGN